MTRSIKKKPLRAKTKPATRRGHARTKTGGKTGGARARRKLTKNAAGEPPDETRFQKGESGNPNGRPPGASLQAAIRRLANVPLPRDASRSRVEAVAEKLWKKAAAGDIRAMRIILERVDGKVIQPIDLTMPGPALAAIATSLDAVYGKRADRDEEEKP